MLADLLNHSQVTRRFENQALGMQFLRLKIGHMRTILGIGTMTMKQLLPTLYGCIIGTGIQKKSRATYVVSNMAIVSSH